MNKILSQLRLYSIALLLAFAALFVKLFLQSMIENPSPFSGFLFAVTVSAWYGGVRVGLVTLIMSALLSSYFLLQPVEGASIRLAIFLLEGLLITLLSGSLSQAKARQEQSQSALLTSEQTGQRHLAELEAIYNTAPVGLCVLDSDLRFTRVNERFAEMNGVSVQEHLGFSARDIVPDIAVQVEPLLKKVIETGEPVLNLEIRGETKAQPGVQREWLEHWFPVKNREGKIVSINIVAEEITEQKRMQHRLSLLNKASQFFNQEVVNYNRLLQSIARFVSETVKDGCLIRFLSEDEKWLLPAAYYNLDSEIYALMNAMIHSTPLGLDEPLVAKVIKEGETVFIPHLSPEVMRENITEGRQPIIEKLRPKSWIIVPLRSQERIFGFMHLWRHGHIPFTEDDVLLAQDIADRASLAIRNAQFYRELRESEKRYRMLVDNFPNGAVFLVDQHLRYTAIGGKGLQVVGLSKEKLEGKSVYDIFEPSEALRVAERYRKILEGDTFIQEVPYNGHVFLTYNIPVHDNQGNITHGMVMSQNITEQKHAEEALRWSAERDAYLVTLADALRRLSDPIEIQIEAVRILGQHLKANRVHYAESVEGGDRIVIHRDYIDGVKSIAGEHRVSSYGPMLKVFMTGQTVVVNNAETDSRLNESERDALASIDVMAYVAVPLVKAEKLVVILAVHHIELHDWTPNEITLIQETAERTWAAVQRARAQAELRISEERYRALFNSMDEGFALVRIIVDEQNRPVDYQFLEINPQFGNLTGLSPTEVLGGKTIKQILPTLEEKWFQIYGRVALTGEPVRFVEGSEVMGRWFDVYAFRVGTEDERKVAILFNDITERKKSELALERYAERLRILHQIDKAILGAESPENIAAAAMQHIRLLIPCDRASIALFDYGEKEIKVLKVISSFPADIADGARIPFSDTLNPEMVASRVSIADFKTAETIPLLFRSFPEMGIRSLEAFKLELEEVAIGAFTLASTEPFAFTDEHRTIGHEIAAQLTIAFRQALLNERVRQHALELEQRVQERTKQLTLVNKELESFSYSVSHDLRSPLRGIDGFSHALLEDYADKFDEEGQYYLERIRSGTQRMGELIDDLLNLSRVTRQEVQLSHFNLSELVQQVAENLQTQSPERNVEFVIEPNIDVTADRRLLHIVLENLLGNAWKFTSKKREARIEFGQTALDGKDWYFVRDNGAGFSMTYAGKLFGAFQRLHTEAEFEGTGIGLATVQRIINRHGGDIRAEGVEGDGATFYFTL